MATLDTTPTPKMTFQETTAPGSAPSGDQYVYIDSSDHKLKRKNSSGTVTTLESGAGSDTTAVHTGTASEIHGVTEKTTPVSADVLLLEDSADSYNKKRVQVGNLPSGMTNPMTTQDDLIIGGSSGTPARLAKGTGGQVLTVNSGSGHLNWETPSGGGGGATIYESAYASPPASPNSGDLWRVTDVPLEGRYNGSAWVYRWYGIPVTIPSGSGWTWFNQGSATLTDLGIQRIIAPTGSSGDQMRGVVKSVTAPYNVYMRIRGFYPFSASSGYGICARQSSDGKLKALSYQTSNAHTISAEKWNSPTSWSSNILNPVSNLQEFTAFADLLYRISDDNTNFSISLSPDNGTTWSTAWNETRTTFATCDQVGFFAYTNSSSYYAMCELSHWVVT